MKRHGIYNQVTIFSYQVPITSSENANQLGLWVSLDIDLKESDLL